MFFGRSAKSLERVIRRHPEWRDPLARIYRAVQRAPLGHIVDPSLVARLARLSSAETIAYLHVLKEADLGDFVARVLTDEGVEVATFPRIADVPAVVEDEFGDDLEVMPENLDLGFAPRLRPDAARVLDVEPTPLGSQDRA
jgi:hypothetical protein